MTQGIYQHKPNQGFQKGQKFSIEHRKRLSESKIGKKRKPFTEETKKKLSLATNKSLLGLDENKARRWKGDDAGKQAMHLWVYKWKGNPTKCERCGVEDKNKFYDWANVDHSYKRILEDYIRMCRPCHRSYDKSRGVKVNQWN